MQRLRLQKRFTRNTELFCLCLVTKWVLWRINVLVFVLPQSSVSKLELVTRISDFSNREGLFVAFMHILTAIRQNRQENGIGELPLKTISCRKLKKRFDIL